MFAWLGKLVSRTWPLWLAAWALLIGGTWAAAPRWRQVAREGMFNFLPADVPSRRAERLLREAFPGDRGQSRVVIVASREGGLRDEDHRFLADRLGPGLERVAREEISPAEASVDTLSGRVERVGRARPEIARVLTPRDRTAGPLLVSPDRCAALVLIDLTTDFMVRSNLPLIQRIDDLLAQLRREGSAPTGLRLDLTGDAVLGRDMMREESESARAIQSWTIWIVVLLLLAFYRAPLLALIPLVSLFVATETALHLLAIAAGYGYIQVFRGLEVYTTVVVYAAGVDYSLFLISRYEEEFGGSGDVGGAVAAAIGRIGGALTASAATVICGIGTLLFARFGQFREAGGCMAFCLFVMLCATLTLTPALLRLAGSRALWPRRPVGGEAAGRAWIDRLPGFLGRLGGFWEAVGSALERRAGAIWLMTLAALSPLAIAGVLFFDEISYGLVSGLPREAPSVVGLRALAEHYPAGAAGGLTVLLRNDRVDFGSKEGLDLVRALNDRLLRRRKELEVADIRSVAEPLGTSEAARRALPRGLAAALARPLILGRAIGHYVSNTERLGRHVTRLDLVLAIDPFTRRAIGRLDDLEAAVRRELPEPYRRDTTIQFTGPTASFRDLKTVAEGDRTRIGLLVTSSVLAVLIALLRRVALPIYLILSVLLGYFVTLGATFAVFRLSEGPSFPGLDWTVPIFLFTLLIAVGEDYNIILVTRVDEEQRRRGPVRGVAEALARTGGTISGCGFIMAGTFSSLAFGGSLARMYQLGFALTFGVLLDTFVIRPILVPAWLVLINKGRLGRLGKFLGAAPADGAEH